MKTIIGEGTFYQVRYLLIFFIILFQACASTPTGTRVEGSEFKKNLPGLWEGHWSNGSVQAKEYIEIINVEEYEVHLTGVMGGGGVDSDTDKVSGRIENEVLLLTWPEAWTYGCTEKYRMYRDESNNLTLIGNQSCSRIISNVVLRKTE